MRQAALAGGLLLLSSVAVSAHGSAAPLDEAIRVATTRLVLLGSALVTGLVILVALFKGKKRQLPPFASYAAFAAVVLVVVGVTAYVAGSTVYLNLNSPTNGPVHWHADFEIWSCGQQIGLVDPTGLSNRVGTPVLHEHGDNRIHMEGVVVDYHDSSIGSFFRAVGGELRDGLMAVPTGTGIATMKDGDLCSDEPGALQVFVYHSIDGVVVQEKLSGPYEDYVMGRHSQVPPGDCLVFEFGPEMERTIHVCESYEAAIARGAVSGG